MKATTKTIGSVAGWVGAGVLLLGGAPLGQGSIDERIEEIKRTQAEHVRAWNGRTKVGDGVYMNEAPRIVGGPTKYEQIKKRLAEIHVLIDVDREFMQAQEELDEAWLRAASANEFEHQGSALVEVAVCRSYLYRTTGRPQAAFDTLLAILPDVRDPRWKSRLDTLVAPPKTLADLANR